MSTRDGATKAKKLEGKAASPYGYPFWDWVAKEDPEYVRARQPLSALSIGEGKELSTSNTARPSASCWRRYNPPRCRGADPPSARGRRR